MALGIEREKFNRMVNYFRGNVGAVLSVSAPAPGELVKNHLGKLVAPIHATPDPEELFILVDHYLRGYNNYPDEPLIEFNNEKTLLYIKPSYDETRKKTTTRRVKKEVTKRK